MHTWRDNNVSKVEKELLESGQCWYKLKWEHGTVIENDKVKLYWHFEYQMRKNKTARRPDVTIMYKNCKLIQITDMACPSDQNINEKLQK